MTETAVGSLTACDGAATKPVILRDVDRATNTVTTFGELQSGSWRLVVDDNSTSDGGILARTNHF